MMRIEVQVYGPHSVVVRTDPSWWERWLLGREQIADCAVQVDYMGRDSIWIWDSTWTRIRDQQVLDAIDRALATWRSR